MFGSPRKCSFDTNKPTLALCLDVMSSPNHLSTFSEDWNDAASWAEIPTPKPTVSIQPELEALTEDAMFEDDEPELLAPPKVYKQGETIGWNNAPDYLPDWF